MAPTWEDWGTASGLAGASPDTTTVFPLDVTGDGWPEPLWLSRHLLRRLELEGEGIPVVEEVAWPEPVTSSLGTWRVAVVLDVDRGTMDPGDGVDEVVIIGSAAVILRVAGPDQLEAEALELPEVPIGTVYDAAAGDLNRDGLVDIVLATSVFTPERLLRAGTPDLVFVNRGHGRFERQVLHPSRDSFSYGITLADMDGDGRLDVVESINHSGYHGPARILRNVTPDGADAPTFEVDAALSTWDPGTIGRGAAVADVDGDGLLDLFQTSTGLDLLAVRSAGGGWKDETAARGLTHGFVHGGARMHWGPSFGDVNADGRLDLLIGHGGITMGGTLGLLLAEVAPELLYLGTAEGGFERAALPYDPNAYGTGRQLALHDLDRDGLPDVALGGSTTREGFWRNGLELAEGQRALTLRLVPTVSGSPATGAIVEATCSAGGAKVVRHVTAGGHFGAVAAPEVALGWESCSEAVQVQVRWPSGAWSQHAAEPGVPWLTAEEPAWWRPSADGASSLDLDPTGTGATEACVSGIGQEATCCSEPCTVALTGSEALAVLVHLDDRRPMVIPPRRSRWLLRTTPRLPEAGATLEVSVQHVGPPGGFEPEGVALKVGGQDAAWAKIDAEARVLVAEPAPVSPLAKTLQVSLETPAAQDPIWTLPVGALIDPSWHHTYLYGALPPGSPPEGESWRVLFHPVRDVDLSRWEKLALVTGAGAPLAPTIDVDQGNSIRVSLSVPWTTLGGVETIHLVDGALDEELPVRQPASPEALLAAVASVRGAVMQSRLVHRGGFTPFLFTFHDAGGHLLPPPTGQYSLKVDEGEVMLPPSVLDGDLETLAMIRADGDPFGVGQIRLLTDDGRLFGPWPFTLLPPVPREHSLELSSSSVELPGSEGALEPGGQASIFVTPVDPWGEYLVAHADVAVELEGGTLTEPLSPWLDGRWDGIVTADDEATELVIEVLLEGQLLETHVLPVGSGEGPEPEPEPEPTPEPIPESIPEPEPVAEPEPAEEAEGDAEPASNPEPVPDKKKKGGCVGAGSGNEPLAPFGALVMLWMALGAHPRGTIRGAAPAPGRAAD